MEKKTSKFEDLNLAYEDWGEGEEDEDDDQKDNGTGKKEPWVFLTELAATICGVPGFIYDIKVCRNCA